MSVYAALSLALALIQAAEKTGIIDGSLITKWQTKYRELSRSQEVEKVRSLISEVNIAVFNATNEVANDIAVAKQNPAMRKPGTSTTALIAIVAGAALLASCQTCIRTVPETEETVEGYAVTWPEDASANPDDYFTGESPVGDMRTVVPKVESEADR